MRFRKSGIMISELEKTPARRSAPPPFASSSVEWVRATGVSEAIRLKE